MNIWPGFHFISFEFNFSRIWRGLVFSWVCTIRGRSHIAPKNAWKTLGALLSPFFQCARAVALRRRLSLLSNHQLRSPLQEGNFVTWPAVRLRHSEKLRCFYLDAPMKVILRLKDLHAYGKICESVHKTASANKICKRKRSFAKV